MSERGAVSLPKRDPRKGQYEKNKCHKKLRRLVGEALTDFNMLSNGDKVMAPARAANAPSALRAAPSRHPSPLVHS